MGIVILKIIYDFQESIVPTFFLFFQDYDITYMKKVLYRIGLMLERNADWKANAEKTKVLLYAIKDRSVKVYSK